MRSDSAYFSAQGLQVGKDVKLVSQTRIRRLSKTRPTRLTQPLAAVHRTKQHTIMRRASHNHCCAVLGERSNCSAYAIRQIHRLSSVVAKASSAEEEQLSDQSTVAPTKWKMHVIFCAVALALASVHRVTLAILAVTFQQEFGLSLPQMGVLQSSMLWGYVLGQLPSGLLADRIGGSPLMTGSIVFWCFASGLMPLARQVPAQYHFAYIFFVRALLGLAQSGIVTSTSAMSARWVPRQYRSTAMGFCYFLYSGGVVVSLLATPAVAKPFGWPAAYQLYVLLGLAWAAFGFFGLAPESEATYPKETTSAAAALPAKFKMTREGAVQVGVLVWTHSVIGWGFTLLQNWIPTILVSLGMRNLGDIGIVSALPWLAASLVSLLGGLVSDWLHKSQGWSLVKVRRFCQDLATLGPAAALLWLGFLGPRATVPMAVTMLVGTAGLQAFCYAGFHSYTQDVASKDAGRLLGLTNTGGTVVGVACNILTGRLAASSSGFSSVFFIAAVIYFSSFVTWNIFMKGQPVRLS